MLFGLEPDQVKALLAAVSLWTALVAWMAHGWGKWQERRQYVKAVDFSNVRIERLIFSSQPDGSILFDRETRQGSHSMDTVFDEPKLADLVRKGLRKKRPDGRILPPGRDHRLMMERLDQYMTGNDDAASQAMMFGRKDAYNADDTAIVAKKMVGDDGFEIMHVLLINPHWIGKLDDPDVVSRIKPRRKKYLRVYEPEFSWLAKEWRESRMEFEAAEQSMSDTAEDIAGERATIWLISQMVARSPAMSSAVSLMLCSAASNSILDSRHSLASQENSGS
jgi:hypothetical protein